MFKQSSNLSKEAIAFDQSSKMYLATLLGQDSLALFGLRDSAVLEIVDKISVVLWVENFH